MAQPPPIPDHELIRKIGEGGYGDVWIARNVMGVHRAVKIVYRERFRDERPFEREYEGIRKFEPISRSHPSQLNILHVGRAEQCFYYVMELGDCLHSGVDIDPDTYEPRTLQSIIEGNTPPSSEWIMETISGLATALGHLHAAGLIHRDVKPSNVIFVHGVPKLADIGLVTDIGSERSFVGTEGYLPPEGPGEPSGDLYGLGKVLYELITGLNRSEFPSLPDSLYSRSDRAALFELNQVVLKACAPAPAERYANAKALLKDLLIVRSGQSLLRVQSLQRLLSFNNRFGVFNVTRFAGATILLLIMALSAGTPWRTDSIALYAAYWLFALASVVFSLSSSNARILNSYSIPVVDMPMLFVMQSTSMALAGNYLDAETYGRLTGATAGYSIAMYSLLIMLATLSVKFFQIMFAFLLAFFFQSRLCSQAGLSPVASVEAFFLLLLVSGLCYFARRHVLVRSTTTS